MSEAPLLGLLINHCKDLKIDTDALSLVHMGDFLLQDLAIFCHNIKFAPCARRCDCDFLSHAIDRKYQTCLIFCDDRRLIALESLGVRVSATAMQ